MVGMEPLPAVTSNESLLHSPMSITHVVGVHHCKYLQFRWPAAMANKAHMACSTFMQLQIMRTVELVEFVSIFFILLDESTVNYPSPWHVSRIIGSAM